MAVCEDFHLKLASHISHIDTRAIERNTFLQYAAVMLTQSHHIPVVVQVCLGVVVTRLGNQNNADLLADCQVTTVVCVSVADSLTLQCSHRFFF